MSPELKAKWIVALRSGEYKQGRKRLRHMGRFCCLGVLCEVMEIPRAGNGYANNYYVAETSLRPSWRKRAGFAQSVEETLADMNDTEGKTFAEIADYIEKKL